MPVVANDNSETRGDESQPVVISKSPSPSEKVQWSKVGRKTKV